MCPLLIAAKVNKRVTVTCQRFPVILKHGFDLCNVLDDDIGTHISGTHGSQHVDKVFWQCDIGKFIEPECHMDRKFPFVFFVRNQFQFLEHLRIQHPADKVVGLVIIRDLQKQCHFPFRVFKNAFPKRCKVYVIGFQNAQNFRVL